MSNTKTIKVALAGAGAFGIKHLDGIRHVSTELAESLALPEVDAVILCTPTQMHAQQAIACMKAGKHVQVEIPLADSLAGAQAVVDLQKKTGLVAMCGHT